MKMATVLDNSEPVSMIRRQSGMISVERRKWITVLLSFCYCKKRKGRGGWFDCGTTSAEDAYLHQSTDNTKGGKTKVFKRACFRCGVKKWV